MWVIYLIAAISLLLLAIRKFYIPGCRVRKNVTILVLGDVGRSPRMQYHALSFLKKDFTVDLIGYPDSAPLQELREDARLRILYMQPPPSLENYLPRTLCYAIKTLWQCFTLVRVLFWKRISSYLLVQNPPAIPSLPICWFYCILVGSEFAIDWHNYAHTIMALSSSEDHFLVRFAKNIEVYFGCKAKTNFCVSKAMKEDLELKWNIKAQVLYDRPAAEFHPITIDEKHKFLLRLSKQYKELEGSAENATALTESVSDGTFGYVSHRPGLLVSSTSWTEDEDFSILLTALQEYEEAIEEGELKLPSLICAITGKGPLKEFYLAIIELKKFKHIKIITPWLEIEDYPKILACADLGVCLHTSSSGLDLPMKVVDMFGCELPVCAYNFQCLHELVKHNENSFVFSNATELTAQLKSWFANFGNNPEQQLLQENFKKLLHEYQESRWHVDGTKTSNNRPIIGILAQEISYDLNNRYPGEYYSYIAASYVKLVEGAGARVVPIWIGKNESYYEDIVSKINGVLWPGGATYFNQSNGYADAGDRIFKIAKRLYEKDDYFPILGICLGFELLTYVAANCVEHRIDCDSSDQPLPLEFKPGFQNSKMFENAPSDVIEILKESDVTANYHRYCVTEEGLAKVNLTDKFRVMSLNHDFNGVQFISSLEHTTYPFYGVQFHPEKNLYEWADWKRIPHGRRAATVAQYFADFFVNEARRNGHKFKSADEETQSLIYNYPVTYTGLRKSAFVQCYMFKEDDQVIHSQ